MLRYILKRLLYLVFVFFILSIILFGIFKMVPGDPARMMVDAELMQKDPTAYQAEYEKARQELGLDKPIYVQYAAWMGKMLTGDFGFSAQYRQPVKMVVKEPLINTAKLNIVNLIFVFAITIPLGITTAVRKYSVYDNVVQVFTVVGVSMPSFVVSLICIYFFCVRMPIFPVSGMEDVAANYTGWRHELDVLYHMALPVIVMTFGSLAGITRYVRGAMIEILRMDFIRTARAKGLKEKVVIYSHAFRNALIPVVTILTGWFIGIFGGSVIIEGVFIWNGIGRVLINSLRQQDFSLVLAMNMFYILLALVGNLAMDLSYMLVDPRVKLS